MPVAPDAWLGVENGCWWVETRGWGPKRSVAASKRGLVSRKQVLVAGDGVWGVERGGGGSKRCLGFEYVARG